MELHGWCAAVLCACLVAALRGSSHELVVGGAGWALQFDGVDDLAILVDTLPPPPLTIELWVRPLDLVDGLGEPVVAYDSKGVLLSRYSAEAGLHMFSILYNGAEIWGAENTVLVDEVSNAKGKLFHYAFAIDNESQYAVYINGSLSTSGALNAADVAMLTEGPSTLAFPWLLGARMEYVGGLYLLDGRCFGGQLDELRWWNVALGAEEIQKWMEVAPSPHEPGLLHRWSFDEPVSSGPGRLIEGGGDASRVPLRVPSPIGLVGGPVVVATDSVAPPQALRVCAAVTPALPNSTAVAIFDTTIGSTGRLGPSVDPAAAVGGFQIELTEVGASRWCSEVFFHPSFAGDEQLPFVVEVRLPAAAGGGELSATAFVVARVADNQPPVAGHAKALQTNGRDSYASLGVWDLPSGEADSHFTFSLWLKPSTVVEDSYALSKHLSKGSNILLFGLFKGKYLLGMTCMRGCNGGASPTHFSYFPIGADGTVLASGKTPEQVRAERVLPHLLTLTLHCHTRGNEDPENNPARATVTMYVDGESIGTVDDFPVCMPRPLLPEDFGEGESPLLHPAPWELGQEYDGGPLDAHLPGVAVTPSNFLPGTFDDVRFWGRDLTAEEVRALAAGADVAEADLIVRYTFDLDDPVVCRERQLVEGNLSCFDLNEASGRTRPSERFTFTNARIGAGATFVNSPFNKVRGSPLHRMMEAGTCASVTLTGSDPDGDQLSFSLPESFSLAGLSLQSGGVLQYCAPAQQTARVDMEVPFDACDPLHQCASGTSGLGRVIFHILQEGPSITHFQVLPEDAVLRLRFSEPTNAPPVGDPAEVSALLELAGLPAGTRVQWGEWERGGQALRLLLAGDGVSGGTLSWLAALLGHTPSNTSEPAEAAEPAEPAEPAKPMVNLSALTARVLLEGVLRNAAATSFPSHVAAPPAESVVCGPGERLPPGEAQCRGCPRGYHARAGSDDGCQICEAGWHAPQQGATSCDFCSKGRFANASGSSACEACWDVLPGSTTESLASTSAENCVCPEGTAFTRDAPGAPPRCEACGQGLLCHGGSVANGTGHQPPLQQAGFFGRPPDFDGGPPTLLVRCSSKERCPAGLELGTCLPNMKARACAECVSGTYQAGEECRPCSEEVTNFFALAVPLLATAAALVLLGVYSTRSVSPYCESTMTATASAGLAVATLQAFSVLSRVSISWPEPLQSLKQLFNAFAIQFDIIRPGCVFGMDTAMLSYVGSLVAYPCFALLLACGTIVLRLRGHPVTRDRAMNAHGLAMMVAYLSIVVVSVLPMQCKSNPDGSMSVVLYRSVSCWDSEVHLVMIVFAGISFVFLVLGFLCLVVWATLVYPVRIMEPDGINFIVRFQFLFARFTPDCFYFALCFAVRNLLIGLIPLLAEVPEVQLFLMAITFVGSLALQCTLWPWRARTANFLDMAFAIILMLTVVAGSMLGEFDVEESRTIAEAFVITGMTLAAAGTLLVVAYYSLTRLFRRRKYVIFLSHHKVGSGLLARWLKILLAERGCPKVFLDSDDVMRLDGLVDTVANDCDNLVLLLTRHTLSRPWCAVEIACACKAGTKLVPVACDGYSGVTDEFLDSLPNIWSNDELAMMANSGVAVEEIRRAYAALQEIPPIELHRDGANVDEHKQAVSEILQRCSGAKTETVSNVGHTISRIVTSNVSRSDSHVATFVGGDWILILGNLVAPEAACACRVLQSLIRAQRQFEVALQNEVDMDSRPGLRGCLLVLLTPGVLENPDCAAAMVGAYERMVHLVPLLIGEAFDFPDSNFWHRLSEGKVLSAEELQDRGIDAERAKNAYRRLFNSLALKFTGHGSAIIQTAEVHALCARVQALLAKRGASVRQANRSAKPGRQVAPATSAPDPGAAQESWDPAESTLDWKAGLGRTSI